MRTVFFDVDTQIDFLYPAGALYMPGAEQVVGNIARLNRFASQNQIPVISTMDAHSEDDPEFKIWPPHCVAGTAGQQKPAITLLEKRVTIPNAPGSLAIGGAQQILLEKQSVYCFTNQQLVPLLDLFAAERYVVYGVATEICVKNAILGLLEIGRNNVQLVSDAVRALDQSAGAKFVEEFIASGGSLTTVGDVLGQPCA